MTPGKPLSKAQLSNALLDPGSVFASPDDVRDHPELTKEQKIAILRQWEYDLAEDEVADDEGMPDGDHDDFMRQILLALDALQRH